MVVADYYDRQSGNMDAELSRSRELVAFIFIICWLKMSRTKLCRHYFNRSLNPCIHQYRNTLRDKEILAKRAHQIMPRHAGLTLGHLLQLNYLLA